MTGKKVCQTDTGHAEVVRMKYDPEVISYQDLLAIFWEIHDPTTINRQGNDVGSQYRSIIFFIDEQQREIAERSIENLEKQGVWPNPIVTELEELDAFFVAEDYHHDYFTNNPNQPYCRAVISPKVKKFLKNRSGFLKKNPKT